MEWKDSKLNKSKIIKKFTAKLQKYTVQPQNALRDKKRKNFANDRSSQQKQVK